MRVLAAAPGGEGHLGPLLPFLGAAGTAGDEVVVVVPPEQEQTVREHGLPVAVSASVDPAAVAGVRAAMAAGTRDDRVRLAEVERFGRLCTTAALPTVSAEVERLRPDLILREPCDYASAVVALRTGTAMAQIAISPGHADRGGLHLAAEVVEPLAPGVAAAVERSPYLSRFPTIDASFPDTRAYGLGVEARRHRPERPPLVWITFGTVNTAFAELDGTWRAVLEAVGRLPVQAIASVGRQGRRPAAPDTVEVVDWVALPDVLARASAVVCHGGSGTTMAALAAGVPLVVIPMLADQPANAAMVEDLGAGVQVRPDPSGPLAGLTQADVPRVEAAIRRVVEDPAHAAAARRVATVLRDRPSVAESLDRLRPPV